MQVLASIAAKTVRPDFYPLGFFYARAGDYLAAVRAFGSMGYSPAELQTRSVTTRFFADKTLLAAERVTPKLEPPHAPSGEPRPRIVTALLGTARQTGGCLRLRPRAGVNSSAPQPAVPPPPPVQGATPPPALAEITVPHGGVSLAAERVGEVAVNAGRFADQPAVPLELPEGGRFASIAFPKDAVPLPWRLLVYSSQPVTLCGLGPSGR